MTVAHSYEQAPPPVSSEERRAILQRTIGHDVSGAGWRIESQTEYQAVIVKGHRPNHILHFIIGLFTLSLWWIFVWIPLTIFGGEKRRVVAVDEWGRVNRA
jgi:hypothetical protein